MFSRWKNPLLSLLLSYHIWVPSEIQDNFRFKMFLEVLIIVSYRFSQILHYSCFQGLKNLGQLPVQEVQRVTYDCVLWNFTISLLFMISRLRNLLRTFLLSYHVWVTSKIKVTFRFKRSSVVLMNVSYRISQLFHLFEIIESTADILTEKLVMLCNVM